MIAHMGANCPAAVPSLLVGCWRATTTATKATNSTSSSSITALATKAWRELATLSPRETSRALALLRRKRRQQDCGSSSASLLSLELELLVQQSDPIAVACFLLERLSIVVDVTVATTTAASPVATVMEPKAAAAAAAVTAIAAVPKRPNFEMRQDTTTANTTLLRHQLQDNPKLLRQTLECLTQSLLEYTQASSLSQNCGGGGRMHILLRAYTRLLAHVSLERFITTAAPLGKPPAAEATLCECQEALHQLLRELLQQQTTTAMLMDDRTVSLLVCSVVCTVAAVVTLDNDLKTKLEPKFRPVVGPDITLRFRRRSAAT